MQSCVRLPKLQSAIKRNRMHQGGVREPTPPVQNRSENGVQSEKWENFISVFHESPCDVSKKYYVKGHVYAHPVIIIKPATACTSTLTMSK